MPRQKTFSHAVHKLFWAAISLLVLSGVISVIAIISESHYVAFVGVVTLAASGLAAAVWIERADYEWRTAETS